MKGLDYTALILTITGAINWGLVGLFKFDLVAFLFGNLSWLSRIIYILVGLSGLYLCTFFSRLADTDPSAADNYENTFREFLIVIAAVARVACMHGLWLVTRVKHEKRVANRQPSFHLLQFYKAMMISS